ncbi:MAG: NYN domain-containing protein [Patescibacteria group bacterium]
MESTQHEQQRVAVFVDVQNLYYSAKNLFQAKVDFGNVLTESVGHRRLIRAFAYVIKADVGAEKEFFEALYQRGFEVREKELQIFYGGAKKGDWDVGICMDIVRMLPKIDTMILVSGDGDYTDVLDYSRSQGVRTEVVAFAKTASSRLIEEAEHFLDMSQEPGKFLIKKSGFLKRSRRVATTKSDSDSAPSSEKDDSQDY